MYYVYNDSKEYIDSLDRRDNYYVEWLIATKKLGLIFEKVGKVSKSRFHSSYRVKISKILHPEFLSDKKLLDTLCSWQGIKIGDEWTMGEKEIKPYELKKVKIKLKDLV